MGQAKSKEESKSIPIITRTPGCFSLKLLTSKPIYKPGDMAYFQILGLDPTTPIIPYIRDLPSNIELELKINDPKGACIHTQSRLISNSGNPINIDLVMEVLSYRLEEEAAGGIYMANVSIKNVPPEEFPAIQRVFRVRQYFKKAINLEIELDKETYFPGDIVYAKVLARKPDASLFTSNANISYTLRVTIYIYI